MNELYTPVDTIQQYMEHFTVLRRTSQAGAQALQGGAPGQQQQQQQGTTGAQGQGPQAGGNQAAPGVQQPGQLQQAVGAGLKA